MKPILRIILFTTVFHLSFLFSSNTFAIGASLPLADNIECNGALLLSCQNQISYSSNFSNGGVAELNPSSCLLVNPNLELREFWFSIDLTGALSYFLDGNGVNVGFEVYSGSCKNLELVSCNPATDNNTYISFYAPPASQYFVRALGYDINGGSNLQIVLNCFNPQPPCDLSIDQIQIAPCIDADGMVDIDLSGVAHGNSYLDFVTCEILTDSGLFYADGTREDTIWQVSTQINGSEIEYIHVLCGNSENYCSDVVNSVPLPLTSCESPGTGNLVGTFMWDANCSPRLGKVSFYQVGTAELVVRYDISIQNNGHFLIPDPPEGVFDILVKINGCLPKGFQDVELATDATNILDGGQLRRGEVSDDSFVNVVDISMVNTWFNQPIPEDSPMLFLDLNCDGIITVVDISVINSSFGMIGDVVPLD